MKIFKEQIEDIRKKIPKTHELGGTFLVKNGAVAKMEINEGNHCRDHDGKLLEGVTCHVSHKIDTHIFHTHPKANRPSSGDLRNAIVSHPHVHNNFIFTPVGIWWYKVTDQLKQRYGRFSPEEKRRFVKSLRFLGHMEQTRTQNNICKPFISILKEHGFLSNYIDYNSVSTYWNPEE